MSLRTEQFEELIIRELGVFFSREVEFPLGCLVTITRAKVSDDLKYATVWLSVLPEKFTGTCLTIAGRAVREFQKNLFRKMATKFVPKITFKIDITEKKAEVVENLINQVKEDESNIN
ncbi:ribosome-binding factor A [Candidatus Falkowbacteria bacterium]|nr:ribosome-binding factor A [Candidatus Falkowbacteria bacterium]